MPETFSGAYSDCVFEIRHNGIELQAEQTGWGLGAVIAGAFYSASTGMVCVSLGSERHVNPDTRYEFHISKVLFIAPSKIINY